MSYYESLATSGIPEYMHGGIVRYIEQGVVPGSFLQAVIKNDLRRAFENADGENVNLLKNYVVWFYNHAPSPCWGSREALDYWVELSESARRGEPK